MHTVSAKELRARLQEEDPNNEDRRSGFALINVLRPEVFLSEHIPGSSNIPAGNEREFEKRFEHTKEIILYCSSAECPASTQVGEALGRMGFTNLKKFEGGMAQWVEGNNDVESGENTAQEMSIA